MHTISKFFTVLIILMVLVPSTIAAPNENANPKAGLKIVDVSKGTMKEIKNDKVPGVKSSSSDIIIEEKNKNSIKMKDSKPSKDAKEHKKVKVSIPASELKKIDADNDGVLGVLETTDGGVVIRHYTTTIAQMSTGMDMIFSEVIVDGFSGYYTKTVSAGIQDNNITFPVTDAKVLYLNLTNPSYSPFNDYQLNSWPNSSSLAAAYDFNGDIDPVLGPTAAINGTGTVYNTDSIVLNGNSWVSFPRVLDSPSTMSLHVDFKKIGNGVGANPGILSSKATGWGFVWVPNGASTILGRIYEADGSTVDIPAINIVVGQRHTYDLVLDGTNVKAYLDGVLKSTTPYDGTIRIGTTRASIGEQGGEKFNGTVYNFAAWNNATVASSDLLKMYLGYAGTTFTVYPNTTRIPATSASIVVSNPGNISSIRLRSNANTVKSFTANALFTADTTEVSETQTDDYMNVSIAYTPSSPATSGSMVVSRPPLYMGTPVFDSNNTNATIHVTRPLLTMWTGAINAGEPKGYNVSIPNNADHGMWLDHILQWAPGVGWNFVGTAPTDYADDISDEITVTVS